MRKDWEYVSESALDAGEKLSLYAGTQEPATPTASLQSTLFHTQSPLHSHPHGQTQVSQTCSGTKIQSEPENRHKAPNLDEAGCEDEVRLRLLYGLPARTPLHAVVGHPG